MTIARSITLTEDAADDLVRLALADGDGLIGLAEMIFSPGGGATRCIRISADEMIRVTSGRLTVTCGDDRTELCAGEAIVVPHGMPRTVENVSKADARALTVIVPVGYAQRPVRRRPASGHLHRAATPMHAAA